MVDGRDRFRGLAESIDHLVAVEFRRTGPTINSGVIDPLFRAARAVAGGPLVWGAAEAVLAAAQGPGRILIATGHVHPVALPRGETDGPPGALALARALVEALDARVMILSEAVVVPGIVATAPAAGVVVRDRETLPLPRSIAVEAFPTEPQQAAIAADALVRDAAAVVTIEKIGPCRGGGYRTGSAVAVDDSLAKVDRLVDAARREGVLTIGIGDLGNEMGMALVADTVAKVVRHGDVLASTVETDHLIVAGCSNWGAYGLVAALAALTGRPDILHTGASERAMVAAADAAGMVDGFSMAPTREVDGAPVDAHAAFVELLRTITLIALDGRTPPRHRLEQGVKAA